MKIFLITLSAFVLIGSHRASADALTVTQAPVENVSTVQTIANIQDDTIEDIQAVETALKTTTDAQGRATILADFQQRETARASQVGALSLQLELDRQAGNVAVALPVPADD